MEIFASFLIFLKYCCFIFNLIFPNRMEQVLKETCSLFRHLILDDDVRNEFSKAHDHARAIASEVLIELTKLLPSKSHILLILLTTETNQPSLRFSSNKR